MFRTNGFLYLRFQLQLPIQTHHLSTSGVGRVVYFYTKVDDSRVTPSIKRKAHALVGTFQEHPFYLLLLPNAELSYSQEISQLNIDNRQVEQTYCQVESGLQDKEDQLRRGRSISRPTSALRQRLSRCRFCRVRPEFRYGMICTSLDDGVVAKLKRVEIVLLTLTFPNEK